VLGESLDTSHGITTGVPTLSADRQITRPGLTIEEAVLLEALVRLKSVSAEKLSKQTGIAIEKVRLGIARLAALGYVDEDGTVTDTYRAIARPS